MASYGLYLGRSADGSLLLVCLSEVSTVRSTVSGIELKRGRSVTSPRLVGLGSYSPTGCIGSRNLASRNSYFESFCGRDPK